MTKRTTYHQPIPRCQAMTQKKVRCARDAVACYGGKNYCSSHHAAEITVKLTKEGLR